MHMSDALISPGVGLSCYAVSAALLAASASRTAREPGYARSVPLMGLMGAFVFAAQMINFSIPGTGSSGHLGGGLLLALLFGPWASFLIMASVLTVQCLFFADGGLLALGCNVFNLGFWPAFAGYPLYRAVAGGGARRPGRVLAGSLLGVVAALELGALSVVVQTVLSGRTELPCGPFALVMLGIHLPIGLIEGFLTAAVAAWVWRMLPDRGADPKPAGAPALAALAAAALGVGMVLAWFASTRPDGLEWAVERVGGPEEPSGAVGRLADRLQAVQSKTAILPDYGFAEPEPGAPDAGRPEPPESAWPDIRAGTSAAGAAGAALTAGLILLIGLILRRWRPAAR